MARVTETISAVNSFIRTLLACVIVCAVGYGGGWLYHNVYPIGRAKQQAQELVQVRNALVQAESELQNRDATIQQLSDDLQTTQQDLQITQQKVIQLDTSLRLLKVTHRMAEIDVLSQAEDPQTGELISEIQFREIDDQGNTIDTPKRFAITGDLVYVDYWVVKFDDKYVEGSDVDRSTSICLFRRIFGESQEPRDGFTLDTVGSRPNAYGRGRISDFEQQIWSDFWNIANDPQRAAQLGIRTAHGEAVATRLRPGKRYRVMLRASGGLSINPVGDVPASGQSGAA